MQFLDQRKNRARCPGAKDAKGLFAYFFSRKLQPLP